ncbi:Carboxymethylenebutenolidase [Burkholderiales bacterium 8X]|nr:Carboxymethylenebutenolidase [Burkholderiales bacterium 8X]
MITAADSPTHPAALHEAVSIPMEDGPCPAYLLAPPSAGPWPAIVFYGDAGGIRPAMITMARQLADAGYLVLVPDPFYRHGPYETLVPAEVFKGDVMAILGPLMATTGNDKAARDVHGYLKFLDATGLVRIGRAGAIGFCMGGGMAIAAAASAPDRFAAVASFHGGNLATDDPASPHRFADRLEAEALVACAEADETCPPEMISRLERAFDDAGVKHVIETYGGAAHGWMVPDFPTFDRAAAERGWEAAIGLFRERLDR